VIVALFVGTRADFGPIEPVITACDDRDGMVVDVVCAVDWAADDLLARLNTTSAFSGSVFALAPPIDRLDQTRVLEYGAAITEGAAAYFRERRPEVLVVLGDRWELLYVVPAAFLAGVRVIHIHGGEKTEGAIDERIRHAVTKLSDLHCVASEDAASRIRQLGEPTNRVFVTGAPGLDRLIGTEPADDQELESILGFVPRRPLALFTYHPPTAGLVGSLTAAATDALRGALDACGSVLVTEPGMDEGREEVLDALREVASQSDRVKVVRGLGPQYPAVLAAVDVVVGNSSSGVIEAATVGVPAVDIGERQSGRLRAGSVIHAPGSRASVEAAIHAAIAPENRARAKNGTNPYGDGKSSGRIADVIAIAPTYPFVKPFNEMVSENVS
jgi:UDP-N-acetylglucosamine 2-epimerase (non-hydrolysing)